MKRLLLGSILVGAGASVACAEEAPPPVNNATGATGGSAPASGAGGTGQAGSTTASGGSSPAASGGTGATSATGGTGTTSGGASTGGSGGMPTGGTAGTATGSAGTNDTGSGGTSGTGSALGGGPSAGGSAGGNAGTGTSSGGLPGNAGAPSGGMSGAGGSGGMSDDLMAVAAPLDGQTILMPCDHDTETRVCIPRADTSKPCTGTGPSYAGTHSFNEQLTLGGEPGVRYVVTLHIRGMTEAKTYTGGTDRESSGTQVPADGLYIGGQADNSGNGYNIYFIRTDSPSQYYYLNSIGVAGDTRIRHSVFESDYEFDLPVDGGSTVCLVSADPNTSAIKNCKEPDVSNVCNPVSLPNLDAATTSAVKAQPYNGQFVGISVVNVKRM